MNSGGEKMSNRFFSEKDMVDFTFYKPGIFVKRVLLYFKTMNRYKIVEGQKNVANCYGIHRFEDGREGTPTYWTELQ